MDIDFYALVSDDKAETISQDTANSIADITSGGISEKNLMYVKNVLGLSIAKIISSTYPLAETELEQGQKEYARRSFAMPGTFRINLAEFYSRYIPVLAANMAARNFLNIQNIIRRGEADGESEQEITQNITDTYSGLHSNGRIIVRTEGTRAVSLARRAVAQRQAAQGNPIDFYVYRALRDSRTTQVCNYLHNTYWDYDNDQFSNWPPNHFFCRSGVIFGWRGMLLSKDAPRKLNSGMKMKANGIREKQFPTWKQMENDVLVNPAASAADALTGRNAIRDDIDLQKALNKADSERTQTVGNKAVAEQIKTMAKSVKKGDKLLMKDIVKELERIK